MPNSKFDWSKVPTEPNGFVDYSLIKSYQIRLLVMDAEKIKLSAELVARQKWQQTESNLNRIEIIEKRIARLASML